MLDFSLATPALLAAYAAGLSQLSQAERPVMLILYGGMPWLYWFVPPPEDMSYIYPTRATAINTLGGAYVDDFGTAIAEINIRGNTGYKMGGGFGNGMLASGDLLMVSLRNMLVQNYHQQRLALARAGQDPDTIQLLLVDTLNLTMFKVYPRQFQLQRSKQSPLLYRFNLQLWGLERFL